MKISRPWSSRTRSLVAFAGTVVLAVLASLAVLLPDVAVSSVDSIARLPEELGEVLPRALSD
jgi:hypothetical protein